MWTTDHQRIYGDCPVALEDLGDGREYPVTDDHVLAIPFTQLASLQL